MNQQQDTPALRPGIMPRRNPNGSPDTALQIVARHGPITVDQLQTRIEAQFRGYPIDHTMLMRNLTVQRLVVVESDICRITAHGSTRIDGINSLRGPLVDDASMAPVRRNRALPEGCIAMPIVPPVAPGIDPECAVVGRRHASSQADNRPHPLRPGADAALVLASRIGDKLHYRDGLITDLIGNVLHEPKGQSNYRPSHSGQERARPVFTP